MKNLLLLGLVFALGCDDNSTPKPATSIKEITTPVEIDINNYAVYITTVEDASGNKFLLTNRGVIAALPTTQESK